MKNNWRLYPARASGRPARNLPETFRVSGAPENLGSQPTLSQRRGLSGGLPQATAPSPFFATGVSSFSDAPRGRFSPRTLGHSSPAGTPRGHA